MSDATQFVAIPYRLIGQWRAAIDTAIHANPGGFLPGAWEERFRDTGGELIATKNREALSHDEIARLALMMRPMSGVCTRVLAQLDSATWRVWAETLTTAAGLPFDYLKIQMGNKAIYAAAPAIAVGFLSVPESPFSADAILQLLDKRRPQWLGPEKWVVRQSDQPGCLSYLDYLEAKNSFDTEDTTRHQVCRAIDHRVGFALQQLHKRHRTQTTITHPAP